MSKQLTSQLDSYIKRFSEQYSMLGFEDESLEHMQATVETKKTELNNLFMAGMGACTLMIRLGAVFHLSKKLANGTPDDDALLMKQIVENLRENLPSDTNWKVIWEACVDHEEDTDWAAPISREKGEQQSAIEKFITFRNKYVHGYISLDEQFTKAIVNGLKVINHLCSVHIELFKGFNLVEKDGKFHVEYKGEDWSLYPFVQKGKSNDDPYIFQGLYKNKTEAELIGLQFGDVETQKGEEHYDPIFEPLARSLKSGAVQVFDHSNRIAYYRECFVGRDKESEAIIKWSSQDDASNILPVYSTAGMGKGALVANIIEELQTETYKIPVLHHYCGSGVQNSLHATLYHLILQGKRLGIWKTEDENILRKLKRLPSKYHDVIQLFQHLLDDCFSPTKKFSNGNLAIVIDGLDEAAVAYSTLNISDWFYKCDDKGEVPESWKSKTNIRWMFTYRKGFYNFPQNKENKQIKIVQPLQGLSEQSVEIALQEFSPSKEFVSEVIKRGAIQE